MPYEAIGYWMVHLAGFAGLLWGLYFLGVWSGWIVIEFLQWFSRQCKVKSYPVTGRLKLWKLGPTFPNGCQSKNVGVWLTWTEEEAHHPQQEQPNAADS